MTVRRHILTHFDTFNKKSNALIPSWTIVTRRQNSYAPANILNHRQPREKVFTGFHIIIIYFKLSHYILENSVSLQPQQTEKVFAEEKRG